LKSAAGSTELVPPPINVQLPADRYSPNWSLSALNGCPDSAEIAHPTLSSTFRFSRPRTSVVKWAGPALLANAAIRSTAVRPSFVRWEHILPPMSGVGTIRAPHFLALTKLALLVVRTKRFVEISVITNTDNMLCVHVDD